jgi:hypothetical protein
MEGLRRPGAFLGVFGVSGSFLRSSALIATVFSPFRETRTIDDLAAKSARRLGSLNGASREASRLSRSIIGSPHRSWHCHRAR